MNLKILRRQSYDYSSNMADIYSSLQAKIKSVSSLAQFVLYSALSIKLVVTNGVCNCLNSMKFFDLLQKMYNVFLSLTYQWKVLNSTFKSFSDTR